MSERLEGIQRRNDNDCLFREDIDYLIQRAKRAEQLESIYRKDWITLIDEAKEMGLSPEQVRKFLREGKK